MTNTIKQHYATIARKQKLLDHMQVICVKGGSTPQYLDAIKRLSEDIERHSEATRNAEYLGKHTFEEWEFVLWPKAQIYNASCGRAGDVDPSGYTTLQSCNRGVMVVGDRKISLSNGEW